MRVQLPPPRLPRMSRIKLSKNVLAPHDPITLRHFPFRANITTRNFAMLTLKTIAYARVGKNEKRGRKDTDACISRGIGRRISIAGGSFAQRRRIYCIINHDSMYRSQLLRDASKASFKVGTLLPFSNVTPASAWNYW